MSETNTSSAGSYGNTFQTQQAVGFGNNPYQVNSEGYNSGQNTSRTSSYAYAATSPLQNNGILLRPNQVSDSSVCILQSSDSLPSNMSFSTPPQTSYQNPAPLQQQPSSADAQSFQLGPQTGVNPNAYAISNYAPQLSDVTNEHQQVYSASRNHDAPPVSEYFSQPHSEYPESHVPLNAYVQQASQDARLSYSSNAVTAGQSSNLSPGQSLQSVPDYTTPAHLPPHPFQSQLNQPQSPYYISGKVSSVAQAPATTASQMEKSANMPQLYPTPLASVNQAYTPASSVQQSAYNSHLNSHSLIRHHQLTQRARATNVAKSTHDQQRFGSFNRQNSAERVPGMPLTSAEWNALKCPVSLIHDSNFLPSDGPEKPPQPVLTTQVNCHPDFMRSTLTAVPINGKLQSQCRLPFGLLAHPFRDVNDLPVIQTSVIVRCRSCRLYINPFVKFTDSGRRWRCPVCLLSNSIPDDFYYDPSTQTYGDPARRPEIRNATVEFIAPSDYMIRPPQAATYVFCFEVSRIAVTTGYLELVCSMLADNLAKMPGDSRRQIAILTYDSGVQFYILSGKKMRMVICQDLSEVFIPDLNGMVNRINDCAEPITELLKQIPREFANTQETSNCLGFVLQTVLKLIGNAGGRVTVFNASIPTLGPGALECRETHDDLTKPKPENLRPVSDFYRTIALDFSSVYISVDLFILNSNYCDIATISGVSRYSGGSVYHYPNFHYDPDVYGPSSIPAASDNAIPSGETGNQSEQYLQKEKKKVAPYEMCEYVEVERLRKDFQRYLQRKIGFEAVLRLRCSHGISVQNFYGNFFMRSVDLLNLPVVNPDAGYAMQLEVTDRLDSFAQVVLQCALLYTSAYGDRRIRVHTLCLPVTDSPEAIFNYADEGAVACLVAKMAVERTISTGLENAREALTTVMNDILTAYQKERKAGSSSSGLSGMCPASLRLLPVYLCGTLRFPAFRNYLPTSLDVRSGALELLIGAPAPQALALLYPHLYAVNSFISEPICGKDATLAQKAASLSLNDSTPPLPCLPLTGKSIIRDGIYLLDTGNLIMILVGYGIQAEDLKSLIGYASIDELTIEKRITKLGDLPENEKMPPPRRRLETLLKSIQRDRYLGTAVVLIRHDVPEPLKGRFINALVEDRTSTCPSYPEYVQMILSKLS
ncbi:hypothetical protein Aperf_G00000030252 [Anoplocephala perfoliata]